MKLHFGNRVTSETVAHEFPFLMIDEVFDVIPDKKTHPQVIVNTMELFIRTYIERNCSDAEKLKKRLLQNVILSNFFGTEMVPSIMEELANYEHVRLQIPVTNTLMYMKRYGKSVAFKMTDINGGIHKEASDVLTHMANSDTISPIRHFVRIHSITVPCIKGDWFNTTAEFASASKYLPAVEWVRESNLAEMLVSNYKDPSHDAWEECVRVGSCYGVPLYAKLLFGDAAVGSVWRKGAVTWEGSKILFDGHVMESPNIQYFLRSSASPHTPLVVHADVYDLLRREHNLHSNIAAMLYNGLSARDMSWMYEMNTHILPEKPE